jgi:hypothetical protein
MKTIIYEMKNKYWMGITLDIPEKKISELEDKATEINQNKTQRIQIIWTS